MRPLFFVISQSSRRNRRMLFGRDRINDYLYTRPKENGCLTLTNHISIEHESS